MKSLKQPFGITACSTTATLLLLFLITASKGVQLSQPRYALAATTVDNRVLFAGGYNSFTSDVSSAVVDIYYPQANSWRTTTLSQARFALSATSVGHIALFAGGFVGTGYSNVVDIFDSVSNNWSTTAKLSQPQASLSATTVGKLALFAGGITSVYPYNASDVVEIFQSPTNKWYTAKLSKARSGLAATTVGNLALFAGGLVNWSNNGIGTPSDVVDIFDSVSNNWTTAKLSEARFSLAATSTGDLALFAGGYSTSSPSLIVDIFNTKFKTWSIAKLSQARSDLAATSVGGNLALFGGGYSRTGDRVAVVDIYNSTSDTWSTTSLSQGRSALAATTVGNLALFGGGMDDVFLSSARVDIFS